MPCDHGTEHQNARPHLAHEIIGRFEHFRAVTGKLKLTIGRFLDLHAEMLKQSPRGTDIGKVRHIVQGQGLVGQKAGRHQRQGSILRPADLNRALERLAAANSDLVHLTCLLVIRGVAG